jgi:uncharacterized delta-60 repeat protein
MRKLYLLLLAPLLVTGQQADTSFGVNGTVTTDVAFDDDYFGDIVVDPQGKIMICGESRTGVNPSLRGFSVVKYNTDGTIDETFGNKGKVIHTIDSYEYLMPSTALVQPDGKILLSGRSGFRTIILRLLADGSVDPNFAFNGLHQLDSDDVNRIFLGPDNKIYIAGLKGGDASIERLNTDGFYDASFGTQGVTLVDDNNTFDYLETGKVLDDGSILAFGHSSNPNFPNNEVVFMKFSANGIFDTSYGIKRLPTTMYNNNLEVGDFQVLPDNTIVVLVEGNYLVPPATFGKGRIYKIDMQGNLVTTFNSDGIYQYGGCNGCDFFLKELTILDTQKLMVSSINDSGNGYAANTFFDANANTVLGGSSVGFSALGSTQRSRSVIFNDKLYMGYDSYVSGPNGYDFYINAYQLGPTLSVPEAIAAETVIIYPNPAHDNVNILVHSDAVNSVSIYGITGNLIKTISEGQRTAGGQLFNTDMSKFPTGIYFFKVQTPAGSKTYKVIKK